MIRILPLFLLLCSACIQLGGEHQPNRFYLLEPIAETNATINTEQIQLEISPIEFPSYLDRPQIVTRDQANTIQIANHDRWAEPLPDNFLRTLQENLFKQLPEVRIGSAPWRTNDSPSFLLKLSINRFDGIVGKQTEVDIRWTLSSTQTNTELLHEHYQAQLPTGDSYQAMIGGLNIALADLSKKIATALINQEQ